MKRGNKGKYVKRFLAILLAAGMMIDSNTMIASAAERAAIIEEGDAEELYSADAADAHILDEPVMDDNADIASGHVDNDTAQGVDWMIDANGKLTVTGTGNFDKNGFPAWRHYAYRIKSAVVNLTGTTDAAFMFGGCGSMSSVDLSGFDTSQVTDMSQMFYGCSNLRSLDLRGFDTSRVMGMYEMFYECACLEEIYLNNFNTCNVINMEEMFRGCNALKKLDLHSFDTSKVKSMRFMFCDCYDLNYLNLNSFQTGEVTDMCGIFCSCKSLKLINVNHFDTRKVTDMCGMFYECTSLTCVNVSEFDVSNVTNMSDMFSGCSNIKAVKSFQGLTMDVELPLSEMEDSDETVYTTFPKGLSEGKWLYADKKASKETTANEDLVIYGNASGFSGFNTWCIQDGYGLLEIISEGVCGFKFNGSMYPVWSDYATEFEEAYIIYEPDGPTDLSWFFKDCANLTNIDFHKGIAELTGNLDTSNVTSMQGMFYGCSSLETLDLGGFDMGKVTNTSDMFYGCCNIKSIKTCTNLKTNLALPVSPMYDGTGKAYTTFPKNLSEGIWLYAENPVSGSQSEIYILTYNVNGGDALTTNMKTVKAGEAYGSLPTPSRSNYTFDGWYTAASGGTAVTSGTICTGNATIYAHWTYAGGSSTGGSTGDNTTGGDTTGGDTTEEDATKENIASGTVNNGTAQGLNWVIDGAGKLTVNGTGDFRTNATQMYPAWHDYADKIISAEINLKNITSTSYMFYDCRNMTSVDLSKLDTSNTITMNSMFDGCTKLKNLDLSKFDTSKVIWMQKMFCDCWNLTSLNLGSFKTSEVQNMSGMFDGSGVTSLNLSGFDTGKVTDMSGMFENCDKLTSLDLSSFDTRNVTDMSSMFWYCEQLGNVDVSFDVSKCTSMDSIFDSCKALKSVKTFKNLNLDVKLPVSTMYDESGKAYTAFPKNQTAGIWLKVSTSAGGEGGSTGDNIAGGHYDNGTEQGVDWVIDANGNLTVTGTGDYPRNGQNPIWYSSRQLIKSATIRLTGATTAERMFYGCFNLTSLDLSGFDTSNVTNMCSMFMNCGKLTSLNLSSFNTSNVTNMGSMFENSVLTSLDLSKFDTHKVTNMENMFSSCLSLTKLDLSGFDTSNVTNMGYMFSSCQSLTNLNLSKFDTHKVTNMEHMFHGCGLTSLDLSSFNTGNVSNMGHMFCYCDGLTSLDLSKFDTRNVTNMEYMLSYNNLKSLDLSSFNTGNVTDMKGMFCYCRNLTSLNLSSFNTSNVTNMEQMFMECNSLKNLDLSNLKTSKVTKMWAMFDECSSLTNLDLSSFDTHNVTDMSLMFSSCSSLTNLDLSSFDTRNLRTMDVMFSGCSSLTNLDLSSFSTSNVTGMSGTFIGCSSLKSLDLSSFDTGKVTNMADMFSNCSSLKNLDLSSFDTSNVVYMERMFSGCSSLTNLDLSSFGTSNVKDMSKMLENCTSLTRIESPFNVPSTLLRVAVIDGTWYRTDTNETVTTLPVGLTKSVTLIRKGASTPATEKHTVTFDPLNGSGIVAKSVASGKTISLPKAPKMTGYNFAGWFTGKNGTGTQFTAKTKVTADITVYAKWIGNYYNIAFNKNGGTIVDKVALSKQAVAFTESFTLPGKSGETEKKNTGINSGLIYRNGYILTGWNTKAKGNGTHYDLGAKVSGLSNKNKKTVKLYAEWKLVTYYIAYDLGDNGRSLATNNPLNSGTHTVAKAVKLKKPTWEGYTFAGWYLDQDYTQKVTSITRKMAQDVMLYAKWTENTYTIKFNGNGGVGTVADPDALNKMSGIQYSEPVTLPSGDTLLKLGYTFAGWNTKKDGTGASYKPGQKVSGLTSKKNGTITLYAQWR